MSNSRCNARKKGCSELEKTDPGKWAGEGYCKATAGRGTDHPGEGRCKHHSGRPPTHGRYSRYLTTTLGQEIEALREDPAPLNLQEELAAARALLKRALDQELVPQEKMRMVAEVSRLVKRIEDVRANNALTIKELQRVMSEMGRVVALHVDDQETIDEIRHDWRTIRL